MKLINKLKEFFSKINLNNNVLDYTNLLTASEINQLQVFNKLEEFSRVYDKLQKQNSNFKKKDALWAIYNDLRLKFEYDKDMSSLGIVFERQVEILVNDRKYQQALETYLTALYCKLFHYEISTKEIDLIDRHFNSGRKEQLLKYMDKTQYTKKHI